MRSRYKIDWNNFSFRLPKVVVVDGEIYENAPTEAVAVYDHNNGRRIIVKRGQSNIGVLAHEYGHWFFRTTYHFVDEFWELLWWHFNVRRIFVRINHDHTGG